MLEELMTTEEEAISKMRAQKKNVKGNTSMYMPADEKSLLVCSLDHK